MSRPSEVHDSCMQHVSPRLFAIVVICLMRNPLSSHFCYMCGGLIVRSGLGQEIKQAISSHFANNCMLFHAPE